MGLRTLWKVLALTRQERWIPAMPPPRSNGQCMHTHTHTPCILLSLPISGHMSSHWELANKGREPTKEMKRMHTARTNCILRIWSKESKNTEQIFTKYPLCKNLPFTKIMPGAPEIGSTRWLQVWSLFLPRHSLPTSWLFLGLMQPSFWNSLT